MSQKLSRKTHTSTPNTLIKGRVFLGMGKKENTLPTRSYALVVDLRQSATQRVLNIAVINATGNTTKKATTTKRENAMKLDAKKYKKDGWIKIDSTYLNKKFYLVKDLEVTVPDDNLLRVTQRSLKTLEGLTPNETKQLFQASEILCENVYDAQFASAKKQ